MPSLSAIRTNSATDPTLNLDRIFACAKLGTVAEALQKLGKGIRFDTGSNTMLFAASRAERG
jgi:hypothetical protein